MTATLRSLFMPEALCQALREPYGLDVTRCVLIRSFVNDVYAVTTPDGRYVLKVYRHGRWSGEEVVWELELAQHLARSGVPVPAIVPLADGRLCGELDAPEGPRPYALSTFVEEGAKPQYPFTDEMYFAFGRLTAAFHNAGDGFVSVRPRRPFDLATNLRQPLDAVLPALADQPGDQAVVRALAEEAYRRIEHAAAGGGLTWGVCHGDVSMDNVFLGPGGLTVYDFDLSGPGWIAGDLTGVRTTVHWNAFLDGYRQLRTFGDADVNAMPWFAVVSGISNLAFHLIDKPGFAGTESVSEGWAEGELARLREAAARLLRA